jgi:hypothetical protein
MAGSDYPTQDMSIILYCYNPEMYKVKLSQGIFISNKKN